RFRCWLSRWFLGRFRCRLRSWFLGRFSCWLSCWFRSWFRCWFRCWLSCGLFCWFRRLAIKPHIDRCVLFFRGAAESYLIGIAFDKLRKNGVRDGELSIRDVHVSQLDVNESSVGGVGGITVVSDGYSRLAKP